MEGSRRGNLDERGGLRVHGGGHRNNLNCYFAVSATSTTRMYFASGTSFFFFEGVCACGDTQTIESAIKLSIWSVFVPN